MEFIDGSGSPIITSNFLLTDETGSVRTQLRESKHKSISIKFFS